MKCLIAVTNDDKLINFLKRNLEKEYFVEKTLPSELILKINEISPFLLFLDMEEISPDIIDKIIDENPDIFIVPIVSSFQENSAREIIEKDIFDILEKPVVPEKIFHILKRAEKTLDLMKAKYGQQQNRIERDRIERLNIYDSFFQMVLQSLAENFSDIKNSLKEILKILRKKFLFNCMAVFLKEDENFKIFSSIGIDERIKEDLILSKESPIIKWLVRESKIIDLRIQQDIPDLKYFASIVKCKVIIPIRNFNGKLMGFITIGEKITNEEITQEEISILIILSDYLAIVIDNFLLYNEIKYQKQYQEFVFKNLPAGIIGIDKDGKINLLNPYGEEILKVKFDEGRGKEIEKIGSQIADFLRRALIHGETFTRKEFEFIPTKSILGISTNVIKNEKDEITGAVAIFQDLTYIKEIEKREREIEENKYWGLVASKLSHELKNPLVTINTFAQMLPKMYEDKEFRERFCEIVLNEIKRINEIINRFSIIAEPVELKKEEICIDELIEESIRERGNKIKINSVKDPLRKIEGDFLRLKEAFKSIIDFIKEDIEKEREVFVEIERKNNTVDIIFKVKTPEIISDQSVVSSGLPFSIESMVVKKIIEAHKGKINFEIIPDGKKFIITLPVKDG